MAFVGTDINTITYIRSAAEFDRARMNSFWDTLLCFLLGRPVSLLSFNETIKKLEPVQSTALGLHDVPVKDIVGSVGRSRGFSRRFLPRFCNAHDKERWRKLYTLAVTGVGVPPVELYKVGSQYFVEDGHHRVSVAQYLGWKTIQAQVVEISALAGNPNASVNFSLDKVE
jgi:hypothetical protein